MQVRLIILLLAAVASVAGDIVTLKNGKTVEGTFLGGNARQVRLLTAGDKVETFDIIEIASIHFGAAPVAAVPRPATPVQAVSVAASPVAAVAVPATAVP